MTKREDSHRMQALSDDNYPNHVVSQNIGSTTNDYSDAFLAARGEKAQITTLPGVTPTKSEATGVLEKNDSSK